jgi:hypothetical protein
MRETFVGLQLIYRSRLYKSEEMIKNALKENNELISIFVKNAEAAERNMKRRFRDQKS